MNEHDVKRLQAHEYHNVEAMNPEPPQTVWRDGQAAPIEIEIQRLDYPNGTIQLSTAKWDLTVPFKRDHLFLADEWEDETIINLDELDDLIALLQRAKTIMNGGA